MWGSVIYNRRSVYLSVYLSCDIERKKLQVGVKKICFSLSFLLASLLFIPPSLSFTWLLYASLLYTFHSLPSLCIPSFPHPSLHICHLSVHSLLRSLLTLSLHYPSFPFASIPYLFHITSLCFPLHPFPILLCTFLPYPTFFQPFPSHFPSICPFPSLSFPSLSVLSLPSHPITFLPFAVFTYHSFLL